MKTITMALAAALMTASAESRSQETFPQRPITMIVPFAAGGPTDVIARIVSNHMSRTLGQSVVVENVVGEAGQRAVMRTVHATPDGYTIIMGHMGTHGAAPALYPTLKYDPSKDFEPIGIAAGTPIVIVATKKMPAEDLKRFIDYARANSSKLTMAHAGLGSVSHTAAALLNSVLDLKPVMVTYGGTGPALNDLVAGKVDLLTDQIVNVAPKIESGLIKAFGIATAERSPALPNVPTTAQAGLPQYVVSAWNALFAPAATPRVITETLNNALVKALEDKNTRARLLDLGGVIPEGPQRTREALAALVTSEVARWKNVMRVVGSDGPSGPRAAQEAREGLPTE